MKTKELEQKYGKEPLLMFPGLASRVYEVLFPDGNWSSVCHYGQGDRLPPQPARPSRSCVDGIPLGVDQLHLGASEPHV